MVKLFLKDLKLFFVDKRSMIMTFLLPIILISLFAFAFGGIGGSGDEPPKKLLVVDLDQTTPTRDITAKLDSLEGLVVVPKSKDEAKDLITRGKFPAALIFHQGYEDSLIAGVDGSIELIYDGARKAEVSMLQPVLISTIMTSVGRRNVTNNINAYLDTNFPDMDAGIREKIMSDMDEDSTSGTSSGKGFDMESKITMTSIVGEAKKSNIGLIQAVAGTAILMLLFSVAGLGSSILDEKENGTIKRLLYSPIEGSTILYGKMIFTFFIAILQLIVMFLFSWLAFGLDIFTNIPALILMIIATAFAVSSFGIFLAAVSKTRQQAQGLSTLIILIMSAIGGSMIPLFVMPAIMKKIAIFSVNYWGIQGFYDIFWRFLPLQDVLPRVLVLVLIGVVMTILSIRLFKKNILNLV